MASNRRKTIEREKSDILKSPAALFSDGRNKKQMQGRKERQSTGCYIHKN
jgi:hypothetical protein